MDDQSSFAERKRRTRYQSAALVTVKKKKWFREVKMEAALLDLSWQGFKIELVDLPTIKFKNCDLLTLEIPLDTFKIMSPPTLEMSIVLKWYDPNRNRIGGIFYSPSENEFHILEKIINYLKKHKSFSTRAPQKAS